MKSAFYLVALALCMSISIPLFSQDSSAVEDFEALQISGTISHINENMAEVTVSLYEGNKVVDSFETKKNGKFKFTLYNHEIYTIELKKKGYYTKRISINTDLPEGYEDFEKFQFDIGMTLKDEAEYNKELKDYPSAVIAFDEKKQVFAFDKDYTETYFDEIER